MLDIRRKAKRGKNEKKGERERKGNSNSNTGHFEVRMIPSTFVFKLFLFMACRNVLIPSNTL